MTLQAIARVLDSFIIVCVAAKMPPDGSKSKYTCSRNFNEKLSLKAPNAQSSFATSTQGGFAGTWEAS